jgi:hypothetical protein
MRQLNWTKIGSITAIIGVIVAVIGIIVAIVVAVLTDNNNAKTETISSNAPKIEATNPIISNQNNTQTVVVNPTIVDRHEEDKTKKIEDQIKLYFLPFISQKEFHSRWETSSSVPDRRPQVYSEAVEVEGRTGKASIEYCNIDNGKLRISCVIPLYSDYSISATMKRKKEGRITDKDNFVVHVTFIVHGDWKDIMENGKTKDILFISPSYNKDIGRWWNELMVVQDAFENDFLQKYFTEVKPMAENKTGN